jgi:hydroxymethylpyrimidine kinase/phosphomethylpyrimidine kinase
MKIALSIAGTDPTGGAGLQADLKTFASMGVYGLSVPSVLTAQNTEGVSGIFEVPPEFFSGQLDYLLQDIKPHALKTGMVYTSDHIRIISEKIKEYSLDNLVIDPVTVSSTGVLLIEEGALNALKEHLFPAARVITPNTYEASVLTGKDIVNDKDVRYASEKLRDMGPQAVIITGGHLHGKAEDFFFDGEEFLSIEHDRLEGEFHGTGCVFSSAVASCLALGHDARESFAKAKAFVWNSMQSAIAPGRGMNILNI